ncbi:MAG: hypothetical protein ABSF62_23575 [Bryobacteraceae bacterium]|jgi:hypothetical protein
MNALQIASWRVAVAGRWTARIAGTLLFLLFLAFFFGEGPPHLSSLTSTERLQFLCMAALFLGLVIAWKWEGLGGLLTVAGFIFLVAILASHLRMWALCVPAIVGAVHIASWGRLRMGAPAGLAPWHVSRSVVISLVAVLAVFLLLCANEMFGQPPLMTPTLHPDSGLLGAWYGIPARVLAGAVGNSISVEFIIHPDGSLTGTVGDATVTAGRITYGRSWFGRLLNINSPYRITGRLSSVVQVSKEVWGDRFIMPLGTRGEVLDGSLFLRNRPVRLMLTRRQGGRLQP